MHMMVISCRGGLHLKKAKGTMEIVHDKSSWSYITVIILYLNIQFGMFNAKCFGYFKIDSVSITLH